MSGGDVGEFAASWYRAWNTHDLDAVVAHWAPDAVFTSPYVVQLMGEPSGTVSGHDELRRYWAIGLEANPDLHFEPQSLLVGHGSVVMGYRNHRGIDCAEVVVFGADGRGSGDSPTTGLRWTARPAAERARQSGPTGGQV